MAEKKTSVTLQSGGHAEIVKVTVNDRAATRQAIIKYLEKRLPVISDNKFLERSEWGARAAKEGLEDDWNYHSLVIHHQGNNPTYTCASLIGNAKTVQDKHMNKWSDIGYHYLIDCHGSVAEGRDIRFKGSHVDRNNTGRIGILLLGDFSEPGEHKNFKKPWEYDLYDLEYNKNMNEIQYRSLRILCFCLKMFFHITYIGGHREFAKRGDYRSCPGNVAMDKVIELRKELRLNKP